MRAGSVFARLGPMTTSDQPVTLRERKKLRTRQALAETAVTLFSERGFDATPLDALLDAVEVSRRTFFRTYRSKEDVALTAVTQFWHTFLDVLGEAGKSGQVATVFRDALLAALDRMDGDWYPRFVATLRLIDQSSSLNGYSLRHCADVHTQAARLLGDPDRLELRLLLEFCVAAWRCAVQEWLPECAPGELPGLVRRAFAAMPGSLSLETGG